MEKNFMIFLKRALVYSLVFLTSNLYASICVNSTSNYKMFGSVLRANVLQNPFIMAFEDEKFSDYQIFNAENNAQLASQIQEMTTNHCDVILGLYTSRDCLVSGPILEKNHTVAISSSCSDNHISDFFPYIYTAVPKLSDYSSDVANYLNEDSDTGTIYAFFQPFDVYSNSGFSAFQKAIKKTIIQIPVSTTGEFDISKIDINDKKSTIIFFTYPLPSTQILVTLDADKRITKNISLIGASSWMFDLSVFRPIKSILEKANAVLSPDIVDRNAVNSSKFYSNFIKLYYRQPDLIEVLSYDMARLSVQCYKKYINDKENMKTDFLKCLQNEKYHGVSGKTSFALGSPFAERKTYLVNLLDWV